MTFRRAAAAALLAALAAGCASTSAPSGAHSAGPTAPPASSGPSGAWHPSDPAIPDICGTRLPDQAHDTLALIQAGGPYPYRSDGTVFGNRERLLPRQRSGYYHEFTVRTPGSRDRGARRIITGSGGEEYWTADHYASFKEIDTRC
ncbi:ribonuclease domain-containing protein [Peterkaempfera bronchialis]|uniref:ribonuclease domain-containing protein n=1 Tax=Peterkaempfera bronchialis TaxID=2126346 RepID=UPI003C2F738F